MLRKIKRFYYQYRVYMDMILYGVVVAMIIIFFILIMLPD